MLQQPQRSDDFRPEEREVFAGFEQVSRFSEGALADAQPCARLLVNGSSLRAARSVQSPASPAERNEIEEHRGVQRILEEDNGAMLPTVRAGDRAEPWVAGLHLIGMLFHPPQTPRSSRARRVGRSDAVRRHVRRMVPNCSRRGICRRKGTNGRVRTAWVPARPGTHRAGLCVPLPTPAVPWRTCGPRCHASDPHHTAHASQFLHLQAATTRKARKLICETVLKAPTLGASPGRLPMQCMQL